MRYFILIPVFLTLLGCGVVDESSCEDVSGAYLGDGLLVFLSSSGCDIKGYAYDVNQPAVVAPGFIVPARSFVVAGVVSRSEVWLQIRSSGTRNYAGTIYADTISAIRLDEGRPVSFIPTQLHHDTH